jgi:hypothetical protein
VLFAFIQRQKYKSGHAKIKHWTEWCGLARAGGEARKK